MAAFLCIVATLTRAAASAAADACADSSCTAQAHPGSPDEAGLLQMIGHARAQEEAATAAPEEFIRALSLLEESGDPTEALRTMPTDVRGEAEKISKTLPKRASQKVNSCLFMHTSDCPMAQMAPGQFTTVRPNDQWGTTCVDHSPFEFQVLPGDPAKLLLFFQEGGACWEPLSLNLPYEGTRGLCRQFVEHQTDLEGVYSRSEASNPYKEHTVVLVNYCSGDAHVGNAVQPWVLDGKPVRQTGYNNTRAAVEWAKANLAQRLDAFDIMGASAGALSVQAWPRLLLREFQEGGRSYATSSVVADSYAGVFPSGVQPYILGTVFKTCTTPVGQGWSKPCGLSLTLSDTVREMMAEFKDTIFAFVNSKGDDVQRAFYSAIALTLKKQVAILSQDRYYRLASSLFRRYSTAPNFVTYQVDGEHHIFTGKGPCARFGPCEGSVYDADTRGPLEGKGHGANMIRWLRNLTGSTLFVRGACHGPLVSFQPSWAFTTAVCDQDLVGRPLKLARASTQL